jgi:hypothetical protein
VTPGQLPWPAPLAPLDDSRHARDVLAKHLHWLEEWALANRKDARNDAWAFWALKIPAILASASAGLCAHFVWTTASVIVGAAASFCIIVDGIYPRGMLRNTHLRAFHDIRNLTAHMMVQFDSATENPGTSVPRIIRESETERERIANYIRDAETNLKPGQTTNQT